MIEDVTKIINTAFSGIHPEEKVYTDIAQTVTRVSNAGTDRMPGVVKMDGSVVLVDIDDIYSLVIYHKINSTTIRRLPNGRGDKWGKVVNTTSMSAFAYWDTRRIGMNVDGMLMMLQSRMPDVVIGIENIDQVLVNSTSAIQNTYQLYQQEYTYQGQRPLPEYMNILQLNYTIETTFKPECFRQCPDCIQK